MSWANRLTILRLVGIAPYIALTLLWFADLGNETWRWAAFGVYAFITVTDIFDGWLARHMDQVTELGRWLDPTVDKLIMLSSILILTRPWQPELEPQLPLWFSIMLLARDIGICIGAWWIHKHNRYVRIRPTLLAKLTTCLHMIIFGGVFLKFPQPLFLTLVLLAIAPTFLSGFVYWADAIKQVRNHEAERARTHRT